MSEVLPETHNWESRRYEIQKTIREACDELGLQNDIWLIDVKNKWRWILEYKQNPDFPNFAKHMIELEALLQGRFSKPIDLRLETEEDKNKRHQRQIYGRK